MHILTWNISYLTPFLCSRNNVDDAVLKTSFYLLQIFDVYSNSLLPEIFNIANHTSLQIYMHTCFQRINSIDSMIWFREAWSSSQNQNTMFKTVILCFMIYDTILTGERILIISALLWTEDGNFWSSWIGFFIVSYDSFQF